MSKQQQMKTKIISFSNSAKTKIFGLSWPIRIIILVVIASLVFGGWKVLASQSQDEISYQTTTVTKGNLISSISGSGTITSGNYTNVTTKTSGVVSKVYVTNGDAVAEGDKIAEVTLDDYALERQAASWAEYLEAKENLLAAVSAKSEADIAMWQAQQDVVDAQEALDDYWDGGDNPATGEEYTQSEEAILPKALEQKREAFSVAEAKYLDADADISNARAKVTAAWRDYEENSATIVAPADGVITDLALAEGLIVAASSKTSETSGATIVSAQTVGKVNDPEGQLIATVDLTEIDIINVEANQKVILTLDAYEGMTFTGKVMAVNTSGSVSSGVTSYPVTILLDQTDVEIYPNMAVSVEIITSIEPDVLLVPDTAITTAGGQSMVQVMRDGEVSSVQVEVGDTNDTDTVILSGLSEGDEIVSSSSVVSNSGSDDSESSPFTSSNRGMMGGGTPPGGL